MKREMDVKLLAWASLMLGTAVMFGAFGAHLLKDLLSADQLNSFRTGVAYQMWGGLAVMLFGLGNFRTAGKTMSRGIHFILYGVLLFSTSIYLLTISPYLGWSLAVLLGPITPLGGLMQIIGWAMVFHSFRIKIKDNS